MKSFKELGGVPVLYDRLSEGHYGVMGVEHDFRAVPEFVEKLDIMFQEIWTLTGMQAKVILSAGAYVGKPGWHGRGQAFDLDAIHWRGKHFIANLHKEENAAFYLGIESVIRKHFGTVLDFYYNKAHRDHFHFQDDGRDFFRKSHSQVLYTQACCVYVYKEVIEIDGIWGPQTEEAVQRVLDSIHLDDTNNWWTAFVSESARRGLEGVI